MGTQIKRHSITSMTFKYGAIILIGLAVAAIAAPMPDLEDYLDADVETSVKTGGTCKAVCASDKCKGTPTNPIPRGKQWTHVKSGVGASNNKNKGCCSFNKGACQNCCE